MPAIPSTQVLAIGAKAPSFALPDTDGNTVTLNDFAGKPVVVAFISNHCPFVKHIADALGSFSQEYKGRVGMLGIMPNDVARYPDDAPAEMAKEKERRGYAFPYLYDESQAVAKAYHAACTPDFFVLDAEHKIVYRGQFDDARPNTDTPVTGADLRKVVDALLAGEPVPAEQKPSLGCSIKWKPGNEPA